MVVVGAVVIDEDLVEVGEATEVLVVLVLAVEIGDATEVLVFVEELLGLVVAPWLDEVECEVECEVEVE